MPRTGRLMHETEDRRYYTRSYFNGLVYAVLQRDHYGGASWTGLLILTGQDKSTWFVVRRYDGAADTVCEIYGTLKAAFNDAVKFIEAKKGEQPA